MRKRWRALARLTADAGDDLLAIQYYERAIALEPKNPSMYLEMGNSYAHSGGTVRAIECYGDALRLNPNSGYTWNNLGNIFLQLNDLESAAVCYQNAVCLQPSDAGAQYNLGRTLDMAGKHGEALMHLLQACDLNPSHADAWTNLGNAHQNLGHLDEALSCYDRALTLSRNPAELHVNRAVILLNKGDFARGWREYESRWETSAFIPYKKFPFGKPQWKGEPLEGKRILLHAEQGFGDAIQFARFIPEVYAKGAVVFLEIGAPLKPLMEQLMEPGHVRVRGESRPEFDYHCSLMSLPFALNLEFCAIPGKPYFDVPRAARENARVAFHNATHDRSVLRVGITWRGNPTHRWNQVRSLKPSQFAPLAAIRGVHWFLLQKDATPQELACFPPAFPLFSLDPRHLDGFLATAAVIQELDLVISIDTVTAHLTGALGKPLWLLLPAFYDWRWHAHLEDSPWYPSARLFRQQEPGIWTGAIERLAAELAGLAERQKNC
jgi:tetratricopeptide (TPR) repeat protein